MRWVSALSERPSLEAAVKEVVEITQDALRASPDLGLVFISSAFSSEYSRLMPLLQEHLKLPMLIGCGAGGVIGMNRTYAGTLYIVCSKPANAANCSSICASNIKFRHKNYAD
ncbi:FIST N-terminal domain-containing protein [Planktothrix agardhii]|uniref:FIST N-terminal domain-containing protein n=1 Tax=Planktothrix agardhii TaxID=1160 RepID=UPI002665F71F|nr:FIST N-terminal domain-containing protein [Planktothrix agardhii]